MFFKALGIAAILGGLLRLGEPVLARMLSGQALQLCYFAIDVFLLLGLIGWYMAHALRLGASGLAGLALGVAGILTIRSTALFAPYGYQAGAALLLIGLAVMNLRMARAPAPLLWLAAFAIGLASLVYAPLAVVAGVLFGAGYVVAGVVLLQSAQTSTSTVT